MRGGVTVFLKAYIHGPKKDSGQIEGSNILKKEKTIKVADVGLPTDMGGGSKVRKLD